MIRPVMHHTNGVLEDSGKEDGPYHSAQPRDRALLRPFRLPEYSELSDRSGALRQRLFASGKETNMPKHYVRRPHYCDACPESFSSKAKLREHRCERHSY